VLGIRADWESDRQGIRRVNEAAFGQPAEADLVEALRAHSAVTVPLVAEVDGQIVGHILFSPVSISEAEEKMEIAGLAPMAVIRHTSARESGLSW
jgi:putative acetyltransferase